MNNSQNIMLLLITFLIVGMGSLSLTCMGLRKVETVEIPLFKNLNESKYRIISIDTVDITDFPVKRIRYIRR